MPRKSLESLNQSMFYVLMAFCREPMCGIDVAEFIKNKTGGIFQIGPATLYTILGKFEKEKCIEKIEVDGQKRTYRITTKGIEAYNDELDLLKRCVADAEGEKIKDHE